MDGKGDSCDDLSRLATEMRDALTIRSHTRRSWLSSMTFEKCFSGREPVQWLSNECKSLSSPEVIQKMTEMIEANLIVKVTASKSTAFVGDNKTLYRFTADCPAEEHHGQVPSDTDGSSKTLWKQYAQKAFGSNTASGSGSTIDRSITHDLQPNLPWEDKILHKGIHEITTQIPPIDSHNIKLLENVHPTPWENPNPKSTIYNLVVIGAGAGGLVSSIGAVEYGAKVALVESHLLGGDCTNFGCVPSKALIKCASVAHTVRNAADYGIEFEADGNDDNDSDNDDHGGRRVDRSDCGGDKGGKSGAQVHVKVNFRKVMQRMRRIRADISDFEAAERLAGLGIDVYIGRAVFDSPNSLIINPISASSTGSAKQECKEAPQRLVFRKCIIASGGKAYVPDIPGLSSLALPHSTTPSPPLADADLQHADQKDLVATAFSGASGASDASGASGASGAASSAAVHSGSFKGQGTTADRGSGGQHGYRDPGYLTNESLFNLTELPGRLIVVGAGPIGVEMAQAFQRFGSQVTLLARGGKILDKEDEDAAQEVQQQLERDGVRIFTQCKIAMLRRGSNHCFRGDGSSCRNIREGKDDGKESRKEEEEDGDDAKPTQTIYATTAGGPGTSTGTDNGSISVRLTAKGINEEFSISGDRILFATGRRPSVLGMGLEAANVAFSEFNGIEVNDYMRSVSNPAIYAAGDCCSRFQFTHAADWMARISVKNALFFGADKFSSLIIPWCTFTEPEIAHVGLYPQDMEARRIKYDTYTKHFSDNDRSVCEGTTAGFVKIHVKAGKDEILGATIVGKGAGDMISEVTTLMHGKMGLSKLSAVIHPYPTRADAIRQTGDDHFFRHGVSAFTRSLLKSMFAWGLQG